LTFGNCSAENKSSALQKIKTLRVNGSTTNISGGLALAGQEMKIIGTPNTVRSIFLLTDGMFKPCRRDLLPQITTITTVSPNHQ
jgi:hypothetical protein